MPRRADHDARRRQVLHRARPLRALRTGVHDLGYRYVAAEAGVSVRLVQYYFPSRHELLIAGLETRGGGSPRASTSASTSSRTRPTSARA